MVQHVEVFGIGEFDVALFSFDQSYFDFWEIAEDNSAVISGLKVGVGEGNVVGVLEGGCVKPLGCLHAAEARSRWHGGSGAVVVDFQQGVGDGNHEICGLVGVECGAHALYDALTHGGAHSIVDEDADLFEWSVCDLCQSAQCIQGGVLSLCTSGYYGKEFGVLR